MKFELRYILKVALIIGLAIFLIERLLFGGGFNAPLNDLFKVLSIHLLYALVLTSMNAYFFNYLNEKISWKNKGKLRLIIGAAGNILVTMVGLVILRFVTIVVIYGYGVDRFLNDAGAANYYLFGFVITLIISLIFHTIFFYKALTEKKVSEQQIVAKTETAKFESLKSQIDPHFLFNSLNVLTSLIGENPSQAERFTTKLSKVYRYVLEQKNKDLIHLDEELEFARSYMELLKMRFENAVTFDIPETASNPEYKIIPLSLQLLLENAIKHNVVSEESPLHIVIEEEHGFLKVVNTFNPKEAVGKGTKVGLKNIRDRYKLITLKQVRIAQELNKFKVHLPLLTQKTSKMKTSNSDLIENDKYMRAVERVEEIKGFYSSLIAFVIVIPFLIYIHGRFTPDSIDWYWFAIFGWGIGLAIQGFKAFVYNPFLGRDWESRKIKEFMQEEDPEYWE